MSRGRRGSAEKSLYFEGGPLTGNVRGSAQVLRVCRGARTDRNVSKVTEVRVN